MKPNFFRLNYNHGRTHSGMIAYLAELWEVGNKWPLQTLIKGLGFPAISPQTALVPKLEYNNIDLALLDKDTRDRPPLLLIEMKVDDAEGRKKLGKEDKQRFKNLAGAVKERYYPTYGQQTDYLRQTELYTLRQYVTVAKPPYCAFITLGTGEWYEQFVSRREAWKHCGLEQFVAAVNQIDLENNELFKQWRLALQRELYFRQHCWDANITDDQADSGDRRGLQTMMRLGSLRNILIERHAIYDMGYEPRLYKTGRAPDTILNFIRPNADRPEGFRYCEINDNGKLNFKIYFYHKEKSEEEKKRQINAYQNDLREVFGDTLSLKEGGKYGKSKTVARLDVGLTSKRLYPTDGHDPFSVAQGIANYLERAAPALHITSPK